MKNYKSILLLTLFLSGNIIQCEAEQVENVKQKTLFNRITEHIEENYVKYGTGVALLIAIRKFRNWKYLTNAKLDASFDKLWTKSRAIEETSINTRNEVTKLRSELKELHASTDNQFEQLAKQINLEQNEIKDILEILQRQMKQSSDASHMKYSEIIEKLKKIAEESDTNAAINTKLLLEVIKMLKNMPSHSHFGAQVHDLKRDLDFLNATSHSKGC